MTTTTIYTLFVYPTEGAEGGSGTLPEYGQAVETLDTDAIALAKQLRDTEGWSNGGLYAEATDGTAYTAMNGQWEVVESISDEG